MRQTKRRAYKARPDPNRHRRSPPLLGQWASSSTLITPPRPIAAEWTRDPLLVKANVEDINSVLVPIKDGTVVMIGAEFKNESYLNLENDRGQLMSFRTPVVITVLQVVPPGYYELLVNETAYYVKRHYFDDMRRASTFSEGNSMWYVCKPSTE